MSELPHNAAPLTPAGTRKLLDQLRHHPNRRLGQNFLTDGNIVRKSLQMANITAGDTIVEIGPGLGTLTSALLQSGATVHAVEYDQRLAAALTTRLAPAITNGQLQLTVADAVQKPLANLTPGSPFKIVANLPYAITTPWLESALFQPDLADSMVLMLQKEAADRLTAESGSKSFGAITVLLACLYQSSGRHPVSRHCFYPAPDVDSVLLSLQLQQSPLRLKPEAYQHIRNLFIHRRKQIGSLVKRAAQPALTSWLSHVIDAFGVTTSSRPETIPPLAWTTLNHYL